LTGSAGDGDVTSNVGMLHGGRRINVVPDRAVMQLEVSADSAVVGPAMVGLTSLSPPSTPSCSSRHSRMATPSGLPRFEGPISF
jgi:hypothetical protein